MRKALLLFLLFAQAFTGHSQYSSLPLGFQSYGIRFGVSPQGYICMASKVGEVGLLRDTAGNWIRTDPVKKDGIIGDTYENAFIFNRDTAFISGYINSGESIIYHTTDGGKSWKSINYRISGWADDGISTSSGEAWLSIGGAGIAYTADYGFHWQELKRPANKERYAAIFFNSRHEGFIGSLWNSLAYTTDNANKWLILPTPLDQGKYKKTNAGSRPEIEKTAIYGNRLLVLQEGLLFYSGKDSIDWKWIPGYKDFFTDPENSALYFQNNLGEFVVPDEQWKPQRSFKIQTPFISAECKNGKLYILGYDNLQIAGTTDSLKTIAYSEEGKKEYEPVYFGNWGGILLGNKGAEIFKQENMIGPWIFVTKLPLPAEKGWLSAVENSRFLFQTSDSLYYFDTAGKLLRQTTRKDKLESFLKEGIVKIHFTKGSQGCYHYTQNLLEYTLGSEGFSNAIELSRPSSQGLALPDNPETISEADILTLLHYITEGNSGPEYRNTIETFGFTEQDYADCKADIQAFRKALEKPKKKGDKEINTEFRYFANNLDLDKMISLTDSISSMSPEQIYFCLQQPNDGWSTTTIWTGMEFINGKNEVLRLEYRHYFGEKYSLPWQVYMNGFQLQSSDFRINKMLEKIYPGLLNRKARVYLLHDLVKGLYKLYESSVTYSGN